jgi:hypothetical protein
VILKKVGFSNLYGFYFCLLVTPGLLPQTLPPPPPHSDSDFHAPIPAWPYYSISSPQRLCKKNETDVQYAYTPMHFPSIYGGKTRVLSFRPWCNAYYSPLGPGLSLSESRENQWWPLTHSREQNVPIHIHNTLQSPSSILPFGQEIHILTYSVFWGIKKVNLSS